MRSNDRKYTSKKLVTVDTPLWEKLAKSFAFNSTVTVDGIEQKVVDCSVIKGKDVIEFFLLRNRVMNQGQSNQLSDNVEG